MNILKHLKLAGTVTIAIAAIEMAIPPCYVQEQILVANVADRGKYFCI